MAGLLFSCKDFIGARLEIFEKANKRRGFVSSPIVAAAVPRLGVLAGSGFQSR